MSRPRGAFERALASIRRHRLMAPGDRVLVGVGGGAASVGLLALLASAREELGLAEVAGAAVEVDADESSDAAEAVADVGRVVRQLGLTFYAVRPLARRDAVVDVRRELLALARTHGFGRVALAHTRDDDALAVLAQVVSGAGLDAVVGLARRERSGLVRPLLDLGELEASSFARAILPALPPPRELARRASLAERLRAGVLPRLRALVPELDGALARVGREARALARRRRVEARRRVAAGRRDDGSIELEPVPEDELLARAVARAALRALGMTAAEAERHGPRFARMLRPTGAARTQSAVLAGGAMGTWVRGGTAVLLRGSVARRAARGRAGC